MNNWLSIALWAFISIIVLNLLSGLFMGFFFMGSIIYLFVRILYFLMAFGLIIGVLIAIKNFIFKP